MKFRVFWLVFLRFLIFFFSAGTLACHIAQIVLWQNYYKSTENVSNWWPHYVPYVLYYVGPGFSIICSLSLFLVSFLSIQSIRGDRILSIVNIMLLIAVIVYNTLKSDSVPYINGTSESSKPKGLATYCGDYSGTHFKRCWLVNGAWLGCIITAFLWILLALTVYLQKGSDIYNDDYDSYDFKEDVPMADSSAERNILPAVTSHTSESEGVRPPSQRPSTDYHYQETPGYPHYYEPAFVQNQYPNPTYYDAQPSAMPYPPSNVVYTYPVESTKVQGSVTPRTDHSGSEPPHSHDNTR